MLGARCGKGLCGLGYSADQVQECIREALEDLGFPGGFFCPHEVTEEVVQEGSVCPHCGEPARLRRCCICGTEAWLIDCGHYPQPGPIAAGLFDGSDMGRDYCVRCAYDLSD